jgi:V8-like Glu-specific endopeptidase
MSWWEATVRVRVGNRHGSGVMIAPQILLTAAHNVSDGPGLALSPPDHVVVAPMFGPVASLRVHRVRVPGAWSNDAADARLFDFAAIAVDAGAPTHLVPQYDYGAGGADVDAAAYGFTVVGIGRFLQGTVRSDGSAYVSSTIAPEPGMSGGPLMADTTSGSGLTYVLAGTVRSQPVGSGAATVALVLRAAVIQGLTAALLSP